MFASPRRRLLLAAGTVAALAAVLVVALVASGGSASSGRAAGTVNVRKTSIGSVLVTRSGRTLYLFGKDSRGHSACTNAACMSFWPPLMAKGRPTAGKGAKASLLGTIKRPGGRQVTYAGHPLYTFALDKAAGQTKGEGLNDFGGEWDAVSPAGKRVEKPSGSSSGSSSSSGSGYGY
jgi:predicted lipoprotein with Yx(FWY)xxD motif